MQLPLLGLEIQWVHHPQIQAEGSPEHPPLHTAPSWPCTFGGLGLCHTSCCLTHQLAWCSTVGSWLETFGFGHIVGGRPRRGGSTSLGSGSAGSNRMLLVTPILQYCCLRLPKSTCCHGGTLTSPCLLVVSSSCSRKLAKSVGNFGAPPISSGFGRSNHTFPCTGLLCR